MKLEINLDESRFKDLVDGELGKFSDEEIHDILGKAISQYVMDSDVIQRLFYVKKKDYYGNETNDFVPTSRLENIVNKLDVEDMLKDVKERVQETLNRDDIIKEMTENMFYNFIAGKLEQLLWRSGTLSSIIECRANEILNNRLNNNR
jgi:hypothetical protein